MGKNVFLNHPYMQKGREQMLKGEYQNDCRGCYQFLENGHDGFRTPYQQTLVELADSYGQSTEEFETNIKSTFDSKYLKSISAKELEISFGNICDLMCVYCSSNYSSLIEAEDRKWNENNLQFQRHSIEENDDFISAFYQWLEEDSLGKLKIIHVIGGETLFNSYFYVFMKKLDEIYRRSNFQHEIVMNVFSNLNHKSSVKKFISATRDMHPNFNFNLMFSNESTGKKAEMIRYGMSWKQVEENVQDILKTPRINLGFAPSFNALSITSSLEFFWFIKNLHKQSNSKFFCGDNYISFPNGFSPFVLTADFIPYIDETLKFLKTTGNTFLVDESVSRLIILFESFKNSIFNYKIAESKKVIEDRKDFFNQINKLILRRNIDFAGTFPEYVKFYNDCDDSQK